MTNSGGLMTVCSWASVNDLAQNKFRSIIHLLRSHLLDQKSLPETPDECARSVEI